MAYVTGKRISEVEPTCDLAASEREGADTTEQIHTHRKGKVSTELLKGVSLEKGNDLPKMINYCIYRHLLKGHRLLQWLSSVLSLVGLMGCDLLVRELRLCMLVKGKYKEHNQRQIKISCYKNLMKMVYTKSLEHFKSHISVQNSY